MRNRRKKKKNLKCPNLAIPFFYKFLQIQVEEALGLLPNANLEMPICICIFTSTSKSVPRLKVNING